jgi:HEAT repeat protein
MTKNRRLRIGLCAFLVLAVPVLLMIPYARQAVFGPRVRGKPLCYWQDEFRRWADPEVDASITGKITEWFGYAAPGDAPEFPQEADMLPVVLSLTTDTSYFVRARVASRLAHYAQESPQALTAFLLMLDDPGSSDSAAGAIYKSEGTFEPALPRLTVMLDHPDLGYRLTAACAICRISRTRPHRVLTVIREALADEYHGYLVLRYHMDDLGSDALAILPDLADYLAHSRPRSRIHAALRLQKYGSKAVPILVTLLHDRDARRLAAYSLANMGPEASEAVPHLEALLDNPSASGMRDAILNALHRIDPIAYPEVDGTQDAGP